MNIFLKMERIPIKYAAFAAFVLVMLATFTESKITRLNVVEGDVAFFSFTYFCNSTKVTLQRGNGAPFYNSRIPNPPLSSNLKLEPETDGKICFLYLTIDPVTKDDAGGYILTAYQDDPTQYEDDRALLLVSYPPGKASCSFDEEYIDPDWVILRCTAPIGSIGGYIMCYQNGIEIPPLNSPQEDETLGQTLLAKVGDLVYCCSSALDQTIDRCECKDSVWDPTQNKEVTYVTEPCPPTAEIPYPAFSQHLIKDIELESASRNDSNTIAITNSTIASQHITSAKGKNVLIVVVCFLILVYIVSIAGAVYYFKRHPKKPASDKRINGEQKSFIADCRESETK